MTAPVFSAKHRSDTLAAMSLETFDVLVIGGGITGAGIVLDSQTRGMKTALVEMQDFAAGTSSRSTKLIHGGLRYLKQLEIKMVAEVGKERAVVYENAPHVTTPEWMLLPFHKGGTFGSFTTSIGLMLYDFLAGVKRSERRLMFDAEKTLKQEPLLRKKGLRGGGYYVEYRTDDARLTIEVLKRAVAEGVQAVNYAKVIDLLYENNRLCGVKVLDQETNQEYEIKARKIINAAGPWVDRLRELDGSKRGKTIHHTKGVHLVFDQAVFPLQQAIYFDAPNDERLIFAIPREGKTYVGTTDTNYAGDYANPRMTTADREYLLNAIRYMFPDVQVTDADIESSWAGLRPLIHEEGKDPSEISRKDEIFYSHSGLLSIAGGKLTGYRKMAEAVVDEVASQLYEENGTQYIQCITKQMALSGGDVGGSTGFRTFFDQAVTAGVDYGFTKEAAERLTKMYGSNIYEVYQLANQHSDQTQLPKELFVQLQYAIHEEMAVHPNDFFIRRTGSLFFNIERVKTWKAAVIHEMAQQLGWDEDRKSRYTTELNQAIEEASTPVDEVASSSHLF